MIARRWPDLPAWFLDRENGDQLADVGLAWMWSNHTSKRSAAWWSLISRLGEGTTLKLKIPLTLAIIPGLVVTLAERRSAPRNLTGVGLRYVIPQVSLLELIRLEGDSPENGISNASTNAVLSRRGSLLPLVYLARS